MTNLVINVFSGGDNTSPKNANSNFWLQAFVTYATDFNDDDFWSKTSVLNNLVEGKWICLEKTDKEVPFKWKSLSVYAITPVCIQSIW